MKSSSNKIKLIRMRKERQTYLTFDFSDELRTFPLGLGTRASLGHAGSVVHVVLVLRPRQRFGTIPVVILGHVGEPEAAPCQHFRMKNGKTLKRECYVTRSTRGVTRTSWQRHSCSRRSSREMRNCTFSLLSADLNCNLKDWQQAPT